MLHFDRISLLHDPYLVGSIEGILSPETYTACASAFPPANMGQETDNAGYTKFALSERFAADRYAALVSEPGIWWELYHYVKTRLFREQALQVLGLRYNGSLSSRFEFSWLPADGGCLAPHTDLASKIVTVVIYLPPENWDARWGGGTDVLRPLDPQKPLLNYQAPFSEFERVHTFPYLPNNGCMFTKTENSWHSVGPLTGPPGHWRRTLTINVERL